MLRERQVEPQEPESRKRVAEVLIRKVPENQQFIDLRLAVLGNVDAGKSTLLGVLTQGELDNGRGRARLNLFRHLHEIQSGRTSSISHEILGFNSKGEVSFCTLRFSQKCLDHCRLILFLIFRSQMHRNRILHFSIISLSAGYKLQPLSYRRGYLWKFNKVNNFNRFVWTSQIPKDNYIWFDRLFARLCHVSCQCEYRDW